MDVRRDSVIRLHHSEQSGIDTPTRLVVRDSASWAGVWASMEMSEARPAVDFSSQMVLIAAMGSRSSGGYEITIDSVKISRSEYLIFVRTREPADDCGVPAVLTQPIDVVQVPKLALSPRFVEATEIRHC
jgi:hypothetical protein